MTEIESFCRKEIRSGTIGSMIASVMTYLLAFKAAPSIDMRGIGNFAFDILPQTAGVAFFCALVTGLKLRKRQALIGAAPSFSLTFRLVFLVVGATLAMFGGVGFSLLHFSGLDRIGFWPGLAIKIAWGGVIAIIAVRCIVERMAKKA